MDSLMNLIFEGVNMMWLEMNTTTQLETTISMTPQLSQSIQMLKMTSEELEEFLNKMEESNPLIDVEKVSLAYNDKKSLVKSNELDYTNLQTEKSYLDDVYEEISLHRGTMEEITLLKKALKNIDERGYLPNALEIFTPKEYEFVLKFFRGNEFIGLGAVDLKHYLHLQCDYYYAGNEVLKGMIEYLQLVAEKRWNRLEEKLKVSKEELKTNFKKLKTLPIRQFYNVNGQVEYAYPDVIVKEIQGELIFHLNPWYAPKIASKQISIDSMNAEEIAKVKAWEMESNWIKKAVEQRRLTMNEIMKFLIMYQQELFKKGRKYVKPLLLKEVADHINRHESTISRAIHNKFVQTDWGIILLKDLFSTRITQSTGQTLSKEHIKYLVKEIIEGENKTAPLSDQKIAQLLKDKYNFSIARRTVTKYREEWNLPASNNRMEFS